MPSVLRALLLQLQALALGLLFSALEVRARQGSNETFLSAAAGASMEAAAQPSASTTDLLVIPLKKQYVPVQKEGLVVAYKTAYFGNISLGSPNPQHFSVVFDTGSGHLIIPSLDCSNELCLRKRRYDQSLSKTAVDIDVDGSEVAADSSERDQASIAFGTGHVVGEFIREKTCLEQDARMCVNIQVVLALDMTENPFGLFAFDGVLGLGLSSLTLHPQFSFLHQVEAQHQARSPVFSVFLARTDSQQSFITFGGYDKNLASSELSWVDVVKPEDGHWQVSIKAIRVGGVALQECEDGGCRAVADTGTSLIGVPRSIVKKMQRNLVRPVPTAGVQQVDCRTVPGASIEFDIGDTTLVLETQDYSRPSPVNMTRKDGQAHSMCRALLLPVDMSEPLQSRTFIWGEPVLRKYYTVYDTRNKKIGFSEAKEQPPRADGWSNVAGEVPADSLVPGAPPPRDLHAAERLDHRMLPVTV